MIRADYFAGSSSFLNGLPLAVRRSNGLVTVRNVLVATCV